MSGTSRKETRGWGPAGWDRGDALQAGLEPDYSDEPRCEVCGSREPGTRYLMAVLGSDEPKECWAEFHGK